MEKLVLKEMQKVFFLSIAPLTATILLCLANPANTKQFTALFVGFVVGAAACVVAPKSDK